jgi:hypothetical protein
MDRFFGRHRGRTGDRRHDQLARYVALTGAWLTLADVGARMPDLVLQKVGPPRDAVVGA